MIVTMVGCDVEAPRHAKPRRVAQAEMPQDEASDAHAARVKGNVRECTKQRAEQYVSSHTTSRCGVSIARV